MSRTFGQVVDVASRGSRTTWPPRAPARTGIRVTSESPPAISSLARLAITLVASESAGPPCGGLYLKPPSPGGLCDGRDHDAVGQAGPSRPPVEPQDRVRDGRGGRVAVAVVDEHGHVVGGEHLERRRPGRLGEPVGVATDEQRPVVPLLAAVVADRLGRRQDVGLVEGGLQAGPAVTAGAERDLLVDVLGIGDPRVVGRDQVRDVDEVTGLGRRAGPVVSLLTTPSCRCRRRDRLALGEHRQPVVDHEAARPVLLLGDTDLRPRAGRRRSCR